MFSNPKSRNLQYKSYGLQKSLRKMFTAPPFLIRKSTFKSMCSHNHLIMKTFLVLDNWMKTQKYKMSLCVSTPISAKLMCHIFRPPQALRPGNCYSQSSASHMYQHICTPLCQVLVLQKALPGRNVILCSDSPFVMNLKSPPGHTLNRLSNAQNHRHFPRIT